MAKDKRSFEDCVSMACDLAEAMGSKVINPESAEVGFYWEKDVPNRFLLIRVGEKGRHSHPFGRVGLSYADFWQAGVFALKCLDLLKEQHARQQEEELERVREEVYRTLLEAVKQPVSQPDAAVTEPFPECHECAVLFHPRCSHDCQVKRNHHDLCDLCLSVNKVA